MSKYQRTKKNMPKRQHPIFLILSAISVTCILSAISLGYIFRKEIAQGVNNVIGWIVPEEGNPGEQPEGNPEDEKQNGEVLLTCDQMVMQRGAQLYMEADASSAEASLRFVCFIERGLAAQTRTEDFGMILAPLESFDEVNKDGLACVDWIKAFEEAGTDYVVADVLEWYEYNDFYLAVDLVLENISYENMNQRYVAWGYIAEAASTEDLSGEPTYRYAKMPQGTTYRDMARSVAYIAGGTMNNHVMGIAPITEQRYALLEEYINLAVDNAVGLSEPTLDGSMPVIMSDDTSIELCVGYSHEITIQVQPEGLDVPIFYKSYNEDVALVNEKGEITALKSGSTIVAAYVAGVEYQFTISVQAE